MIPPKLRRDLHLRLKLDSSHSIYESELKLAVHANHVSDSDHDDIPTIHIFIKERFRKNPVAD